MQVRSFNRVGEVKDDPSSGLLDLKLLKVLTSLPKY